MNLDAFIDRLSKLRRELGDVPVIVQRTYDTYDSLEPAEPSILDVVNNGLAIWRIANNNDHDCVVEKAIEIS